MIASASDRLSGFSLHPASVDELDDLRVILSETWRETYAPLVGASAVEDMRRDLLSDEALAKTLREGDTLLARRRADGRAAGLIHARGRGEDVFVRRLYVRPGFQGAGLGRALLSAIEKETGAARIRLDVQAANVAAIRFYQAMGFVEIGRGQEMIAGVRFDIRRLERRCAHAV